MDQHIFPQHKQQLSPITLFKILILQSLQPHYLVPQNYTQHSTPVTLCLIQLPTDHYLDTQHLPGHCLLTTIVMSVFNLPFTPPTLLSPLIRTRVLNLKIGWSEERHHPNHPRRLPIPDEFYFQLNHLHQVLQVHHLHHHHLLLLPHLTPVPIMISAVPTQVHPVIAHPAQNHLVIKKEKGTRVARKIKEKEKKRRRSWRN